MKLSVSSKEAIPCKFAPKHKLLGVQRHYMQMQLNKTVGLVRQRAQQFCKQRSLPILTVAQREDVKNCTEENIFICPNSRAAFRAISSPSRRPILGQECGNALGSLARQKGVGLAYAPEHIGI
ncbi:hypothetical protein NQ315_006863 [Exocentrus adspersus]|uniref:Ribosomal protein S14 n=1 Tax=Exocentrus adspersus TaxID=1586481 RepID=A0AAV8WD19_9CUCU|nr:hypothetical protein NQ315_006863 [Exocentrus adspersus]